MVISFFLINSHVPGTPAHLYSSLGKEWFCKPPSLCILFPCTALPVSLLESSKPHSQIMGHLGPSTDYPSSQSTAAICMLVSPLVLSPSYKAHRCPPSYVYHQHPWVPAWTRSLQSRSVVFLRVQCGSHPCPVAIFLQLLWKWFITYCDITV